ncbi:mobilization protein [Niveibacterium sp. SC-1]|uniref:mobilization protein n=1 Tax=Niveibacterium sp. SC-1 TaxID=3135646 RepID=UPI00311F0928
MSSLNFIGGEKGGVGKSVAARVLAQYFIDRNQPFTGFDTDRSHASFARFYGDFASPVVVERYEAMDKIAEVFDAPTEDGQQQSAIVDLAAQTAAPLARWIKESDVLPLFADLGVAVNFWHVADGGKDSADLLERLIDTYGEGPNYFVVRNLGRSSDFSLLEQSAGLARVLKAGGRLITLPPLHEASMNKIDRQNASFWGATNNRDSPDALGLLERQRVKAWLRAIYATLDELPL